jgi:pilus assembly protein CpaF
MQVVLNDVIHNRAQVAYDGVSGFTVGSASTNQIALTKSRFVSPLHLTVDRGVDGWQITVHPDAAPTEIDGALVAPGATVTLKEVSEVALPGYVLTFRREKTENYFYEPGMSNDAVSALQRELHRKVVDRLNQQGENFSSPTPAVLLKIGLTVDDLLRNDYQKELGAVGSLRIPTLSFAMRSRLQRHLAQGAFAVAATDLPGYNSALEQMVDAYDEEFLRKLRGNQPVGNIAAETFFKRFAGLLEPLVAAAARKMPENLQVYLIANYLKKCVCDLIFGLGPLQQLLDIEDISEIMIVSPALVYIEQSGKLQKSNCVFSDDEELLGILERIVAPLGRRVDRSSPIVDARLSDGSRVNAVIPPLALKGPCVTIRRFPSEQVTYNHLLKWGSITEAAIELLRGVARARKNIIVAGGTGSGKTTMLNVLSNFIPEQERLITIEDAAELQLQHEHLVSLETRPKNVEGKGEVTIRDLIKNALRMRPDRIIVGECRGGEAFDMLQAMNTGHNGSMTTVHANSAADVLTRLEAMCLMAAEIPVASIRRQISQAIDYIVYLERLPNRQRMTTAVAEVGDIDPASGEILVRLIMTANYYPAENLYKLEMNGYIPSVLPELSARQFADVGKIFGAA